MDRISRHSQGEDSVHFGDLIATLLFADDVGLLASSDCDFQHALGWFAVCRVSSGRDEIRTSESEAMVLCQKKGGLLPLGWE